LAALPCPAGNKVGYAEMQIGDSRFMLAEEDNPAKLAILGWHNYL
jgi:hypothetical protein